MNDKTALFVEYERWKKADRQAERQAGIQIGRQTDKQTVAKASYK